MKHLRHWQRKLRPRLIALILIRVYQLTFSSLIGRQCRYMPSCSEFSYNAVKRFGLFKGGAISLLRIFSCHPWGGQGYDPTPSNPQQYRARFKYCSKRKEGI